MSTSQAGVGEGVVFRFERRVNANADLDSLAPRFAVEAREALQEHLAALFQPEAAPPEHSEEQSANQLPPQEQQENSSSSEPVLLPIRITEARHEELAEENTARHDWIAEEGRQQRDVYGSRPPYGGLQVSVPPILMPHRCA